MYSITSQMVNQGTCTTTSASTLDAAHAQFEAAIAEGCIFVELYDEDNDSQLRVEYPEPTWV